MELGVAFASLASIPIIAGALIPCAMSWLGTTVLGVGTLHPEDGVAARLQKLSMIPMYVVMKLSMIPMYVVQKLSMVPVAVVRAHFKGFIAGANQGIAMSFITSKLSDL